MKTEVTEIAWNRISDYSGGMAWVAEYHLDSRRIKCRWAWAYWSCKCSGGLGTRTDPGGKETDR